MAQLVKNLSAMWETRVQFLGREDPLEKGMATHSSTLVWEIPWTEEPGGLRSIGSEDLDTTWQLNHHQHISTPTVHQPTTTVSSLSLAAPFQNDFSTSFIN